MKPMNKAIICIIFGFIVAMVSCSAIRMGKANIQQQKPPVILFNESPPAIPAMVVVPVSNNIYRTDHNRPFKDSVINALKNIQESINRNEKKIDTGLMQQAKSSIDIIQVNRVLISMQDKINLLQLDTARLYKSTKATNEVKHAAIIGDTFKTYLTSVITFMAGALIILLIATYYYHRNLSRKIDRINR